MDVRSYLGGALQGFHCPGNIGTLSVPGIYHPPVSNVLVMQVNQRASQSARKTIGKQLLQHDRLPA